MIRHGAQVWHWEPHSYEQLTKSQRNAKLNLDKACLRSSKKNRETVYNINENHMYYFVWFFFSVRIVSHTCKAHLTQAYCSLGIARGIKRQGKKGGFLSIIWSQSRRCWAVLAAEGTLCQLCTLCRRSLSQLLNYTAMETLV